VCSQVTIRFILNSGANALNPTRMGPELGVLAQLYSTDEKGNGLTTCWIWGRITFFPNLLDKAITPLRIISFLTPKSQ